eukprot:2345431-Alexandrium_andersonii.AAC.1
MCSTAFGGLFCRRRSGVTRAWAVNKNSFPDGFKRFQRCSNGSEGSRRRVRFSKPPGWRHGLQRLSRSAWHGPYKVETDKNSNAEGGGGNLSTATTTAEEEEEKADASAAPKNKKRKVPIKKTPDEVAVVLKQHQARGVEQPRSCSWHAPLLIRTIPEMQSALA